ncbi:unnamed protein product [Nippostrongylus brasiliensis]|uniref:Secreted protein n=1 Tax=Nippostrongylus brasiliensis TaxID=27835 RepID=A0A0N4XUE0_NIPBR|nr:unnamed protein product [Nippostrongylus brasiliensis]
MAILHRIIVSTVVIGIAAFFYDVQDVAVVDADAVDAAVVEEEDADVAAVDQDAAAPAVVRAVVLDAAPAADHAAVDAVVAAADAEEVAVSDDRSTIFEFVSTSTSRLNRKENTLMLPSTPEPRGAPSAIQQPAPCQAPPATLDSDTRMKATPTITQM